MTVIVDMSKVDVVPYNCLFPTEYRWDNTPDWMLQFTVPDDRTHRRGHADTVVFLCVSPCRGS